jgi:hypothetical protein
MQFKKQRLIAKVNRIKIAFSSAKIEIAFSPAILILIFKNLLCLKPPKK